MFQKVQLRLALLCCGITAFILLIMSFGYLYISEQSLKAGSFASFQNDMNIMVSNLEHQTVITHEWLSKMENNGKYLIQIMDNGVPLLYNERESETQKLLFQEALHFYENRFEIAETDMSSEMSHIEFTFSSAENSTQQYHVCIAVGTRNGSVFQMILLAPLNALKQQIQKQRLLFLLLDITAIAALSLFAWYFTKQILKPLQENQEKQTQFVAAASHELRTPLAAILSCASAMEKASDTERDGFLKSIQSEGSRMSRLIEDMLLLTTSGSRPLLLKQTEADTMLLILYESFLPVTAEKNLHLSITLPETAVPRLLCDEERIKQTLVILLDNAIHYTPDGGSIRLSLSFHEKNMFLSVIDNGIGIPDSEKENVFDRFYRADKSRSEKEHFGLGLSIASEIIQAHHGKITLSDTPGGGSTFTIILPLKS